MSFKSPCRPRNPAGEGIASLPLLLVPLVLLGILAGCSTYQNMTAYFNTYYNAQKTFDAAYAELQKAPQPARDTNYFAPYNTPPGAVKKFETVIEKCSKLIQYHAESNLVEEAIMMIGKAYAYQNETESAGRKFRELIDNFPESEYRYQARLWEAKVLYQGNRDQDALVAATDLSAELAENGDEDVRLESMMLQAQIFIDRGEYVRATELLETADELGGSGELMAATEYQLGTIHERVGNYDQAINAYHRVRDHDPDPEMAFTAELREGVCLSKAGYPSDALIVFDGLLDRPLRKEQEALIDFESANAYFDMGDSLQAFLLYDVVDSVYDKTDAAARSFYRRGEILETRYRDLEYAFEMYKLARTEFPSSAITPLAARKFTSFDHYFKTLKELDRTDSLIASADSAALRGDSLGLAGDRGPSDSSAARAATAAPRDSLGAAIGGLDPAVFEAPATRVDTVRTLQPSASTLTPGSRDESLDMLSIRRRPRHLIIDDLAPVVSDSAAVAAEQPVMGPVLPGGKRVDPKAQPGAPKTAVLSREELGQRAAALKYELGGIHFLDLQLEDSALHYYNLVLTDHPGSALAPKALYAQAEVHRSLGDSAAVDSLYDLILVRYDSTEYAVHIRAARGLDTTGTLEDPVKDRYQAAEQLLQEQKTEEALDGFKVLYAEANGSPYGPKACYTVGWIYENVVVDLDSAAFWYKTLIKEHPKSVFAENAIPKVAVMEDTTKLGQYVKYKQIAPIPKPEKKAFGLVPVVPQAAPPPGADSLDEDLMDDEEEEEEEEEEPDEPDEPDPDDPDDSGIRDRSALSDKSAGGR